MLFIPFTDMALINKIAKQIEASVVEFTELIATKYNLDQDVLMEMWTDITKMKSKSKPKKMSAYQVFSAEQRKLLKDMNPAISFGEISKEIGKRWKSLSAAQKAVYAAAPASVSNDADEVAAPASAAPEIDATMDMDTGDAHVVVDLHSLTKARLLEMCVTKGIKIVKSKTKDQIIAAIQDAQEEAAAATTATADDDANDTFHSTPTPPVMGDAGHEDDDSGHQSASDSGGDDDESDGADSSSDDGADSSGDDGSDEDDDMMVEYQSMKAQDLAALCKSKGLPSKGTREILIRRLLAAALV